MQGIIIALCAALVAGAGNGSSANNSPLVPGEFLLDLNRDGSPERLLWHRPTGRLRLFLPRPDGGEDTISLWNPPGPGRPGTAVRDLTPDGGLDLLVLGRSALYVFGDGPKPGALRPPALVIALPGEPRTPLDSTGLDAAVVEIATPVGEVDSNALVTPAAWIANLSPVGCTIAVRFDIGGSYSETTHAYVGSFQARQFLFPDWRALPLGDLAVRCSTMLPGDTWNANDMIADSISVVGRRDAAALEILSPTGTVDSGTPIVPLARIANQGTSTESIPVRLNIGTAYHDTVLVLLEPGQDTAVSFRTWQAEPVGLLNVRCSTMLADDELPVNNRASGSVIVKPLVDAAALTVLAPVGALDSGTVVTPRATVANLSTTTRSFPVRLTIGSIYTDTVSVALAPRETTTVSFRDWTASPLGFLAVRCSTMLTGDENNENDTANAVVEVGVRIDAWARTILAPIGTIDSGTVVTPAAQLTNNGTRPAHIPARFTIGHDYDRTDSLFLAPGASGSIFFPSWSATPVGLLAVRCSTALAGDTFPANDTVSASVSVVTRTDAELSAIL
ncbi:MAG TPA: hypothetical protein ENN51_02655, partial [candidate division WOR-3 bacterium]|nr:hypothetical protein [candidate division WOR-3 bacterium]